MTASAGTCRRAGRPALARLTATELRLFLRERGAVFWGVAFPVVLLVIFGSIPAFHRPSRALGGLTYLQAYVPVLMAMVLALLGLSAGSG